MNTAAQIGVIAAIALLGAVIGWRIAGPPVRLMPDEVELSTVVEEWGGQVLWVDARTRDEWRRNGLAGSVLITMAAGEDFDALIAEAAERLVEAQRVVIYCGEPGCGSSREVAKRLREFELGPEYFALYGGFSTLTEAGLVNGSK